MITMDYIGTEEELKTMAFEVGREAFIEEARKLKEDALIVSLTYFMTMFIAFLFASYIAHILGW